MRLHLRMLALEAQSFASAGDENGSKIKGTTKKGRRGGSGGSGGFGGFGGGDSGINTKGAQLAGVHTQVNASEATLYRARLEGETGACPLPEPPRAVRRTGNKLSSAAPHC